MEKYRGLSTDDVILKQKRDGYNELPTQKSKNILYTFISLFREPMIILLTAAGIIYLLLGEPKDAAILLISIFVVITLTLYQERKTENALQALRDLSSPRAIVIRNNEQTRIPGKEVVVDDIIVLNEGDRVPADATILFAQNLQINESLLTGESLPVNKIEWDTVTKKTQPGGDNTPFVYSGTLISQGTGIAKVTAVGASTEMGKIGKTLSSITDEDSLIKKEISGIVKLFLLIGIVLCGLLIFVQVIKSVSPLHAFLSGLTLSMAMLPEEFPVVLMIFFSLGAWRISKKQVLTRNSQAIETLGATTVLCVDKTGTLTHNKMELSILATQLNKYPVSNINRDNVELFEYAKLSSKRHAFDPLEKEINEKFEMYVEEHEEIHKDWHLKKHYNITNNLFVVTRVWQSPTSGNLIVAAKGAPESILSLCNISEIQKSQILETVENLSAEGQRVLAVAKGVFRGKESELPDTHDKLEYHYLGLIGFVDPLRPSVQESMKECYNAGIRVIMITGDYPGTARYIAKQAGIRNNDQYITGSDLEKLNQEELSEKIKNINIFCRVIPEQKLKIINALKANGEIVAMTGDGVNDGPALKTAHIGIAMGERGTDVARESADLVLINDDFTSIVTAVKMGRRIYDNLQKAVSFIYSVHIPIAGIAVLPTLFDLPAVLYPVHIAFLELIIDPACSTVYESEHAEKEIMDKPPRNITQKLFNKPAIIVASLQGLALLVSVISVYLLMMYLGRSIDTSRTIAFLTMIFCNILLIFANLSKYSAFVSFEKHQNKAFYVISGGTTVFMLIVLSLPFLRELFHFSEVSLWDFVIVSLMTFICYLWLEFFKLVKTQNILHRRTPLKI